MSWLRPRSARTPPAAATPGGDIREDHVRILESVLASVDAAVLAVDDRLRRLFANAAADRLLPSLARLPELTQWIETVVGGGASRHHRLLLADGRTLDVHVTPGFRSARAVVVARDITATVHLETARRDFIAAISHELRTPLASIQGYAELLLRPALAEPLRAEYLNTVIQNAERLARLARDLVTLSSIETGTYPFRFEIVEAAALVAPAMEVLRPLALEQASQLQAGPVAHGRIRADRDALHRVLVNLIENALLHAGTGITVEVSGAVEGGQYIFRVCDGGRGISAADQERIFERFYRVLGRAPGGDTGPVHSSTGLGLALAKHIILEHGGQLAVESALGAGSTFVATLPLS